MQKTQTFLKENKNLMISIGVIVIIIVLGLVFSKGKVGDKNTTDNKSEDASFVDEAIENEKPFVVTKDPETPPIARLSYDDAVVKYASSRIQFGENCSATPFMSTYKNNTVIMIDNRSGESKTFMVGSVPYFVPAYDYTLVTLAYSNLPQTVYIDCGKQLNVATILVQL